MLLFDSKCSTILLLLFVLARVFFSAASRIMKFPHYGVFGNYGVPVDEVADNPTFRELRNNFRFAGYSASRRPRTRTEPDGVIGTNESSPPSVPCNRITSHGIFPFGITQIKEAWTALRSPRTVSLTNTHNFFTTSLRIPHEIIAIVSVAWPAIS